MQDYEQAAFYSRIVYKKANQVRKGLLVYSKNKGGSFMKPKRKNRTYNPVLLLFYTIMRMIFFPDLSDWKNNRDSFDAYRTCICYIIFDIFGL